MLFERQLVVLQLGFRAKARQLRGIDRRNSPLGASRDRQVLCAVVTSEILTMIRELYAIEKTVQPAHRAISFDDRFATSGPEP